ncbi:juvenile hormone epoxide hydrolase 1-like [Diabrotica undecimpunctata]|uniref:juvenile hormone epoxide hydrolase 1-like n=1 Tax=Diabrotica undecimpunctata TaxID=50387 RepID=UPI003B63D2A3
MGCCAKVGAVVSVLLAILIIYSTKCLLQTPEVPDLGERWWKVAKPAKEDTSIKPFKIQISDEILKDLKDRLDHTLPFQPPLDGVNQNYGMNTNLLKTIVDYWKNKYDWRQREKFFNQYPQFTTNIQGLNIHFLHVKPANTKGLKVFPMLMLHGWPGSVREFYEIIPLLTKPQNGRDFVFELIIPSLPGYGFSEAAEVPGLSPPHVAVIMKNLMARLGFRKYYLQGGDWGSTIISNLASFFPEKVLGVHSNLCYVNSPLSNLKLALGSLMPSLVVEADQQHLVYPRIKIFGFVLLETGYMHLQSTKPDTVGVALRESPVGLAAYIIEKFTTWTNPAWRDLEDGGLTKKFTLEKLLDNVMVYWVTRSITTSMRLYAEAFNYNYFVLNTDGLPIHVPSACSQFEHEILYIPESILKERYRNLLLARSHKTGGHFAAFEAPNVLAKDTYDFVEKVQDFYNQKPKN